MAKERSFLCTLLTQVSLCVGLYFSLNLGQTQNPIDGLRTAHGGDVYFISVRGGIRPLKLQNHLLKQMEKVAKMFKARFIVNISEMGENDPLTLNASMLFQSPSIPWYTTTASKGWFGFQEQINASRSKILDVIGVNTGSLQDYMHTRSARGLASNRLIWLKQALEATTGNWLVVVGYHPVICEETKEETKVQEVFEPLHHIFTRYGVNAYLSIQGCCNHTLKDGVAYIGVPPSSLPSHGGSFYQQEAADGFLLHRVSSLQIDTYFITSSGEIMDRTVLGQRGLDSI